jgi:hypothetical protein
VYNASVVRTTPRSGSRSLQVQNIGGVWRTLNGLQPNTRYQLKGFLKLDTNGGDIYLYVKGTPDGEVNSTHLSTSSSSYTEASLIFKTGPTQTSVELGTWKSTTLGKGQVDDLSLVKLTN